MKHYYYLGCHEGDCCVIESLIRIITEEDIAEVLPFCKIHSTDWGGRDKIGRTCELEGFIVVGAPINLKKFYTHRYEDYDNGSRLTGSFRFNEIQEVVKLPTVP